MTRRLPWKTADAAERPSPASVKQQRDSPRAASIKREPSVLPSATAQTRLPVTPRRRGLSDREFTRSPSTSPPPEPPKEQLMIPGLDNDDRYRMVEDEFLAVARLFTTHLHRAEYTRLRTLAASQNAAAIREIERPVVVGSRQSADARRRGEAKKREMRQQTLLGEGDAGGMMTGLRGLLESPRKDRRRIGKGLGREAMRTRAEVGFRERSVRRDEEQTGVRHMEETADEETGDEPELPSLRLTSTSKRDDSSPRETPHDNPAHRKPPTATTPSTTRTVIEIDDDGDDDDPFGITRRKARREKSREQLRRAEATTKSDRDTMPSFL